MGRKRKTYDELTFTDDFMFCEVMRSHPEICRQLAELITGRRVLRITPPEAQKQEKFLATGKGVRFDVCFADEADTVYDLEMQTSLKKGIRRRVRYYGSMIDMDHLRQGTRYSELPDSYIIFICLDDPFGKNAVKYTFQETCREYSELELGDGRTTIFLNASGTGKATPELQKFVRYLKHHTTESALTEEIERAVQSQRDDEEGRRRYMTLEEHYEEEREEGRAEGRENVLLQLVSEGSLEPAIAAMKLNISVNDLSKKAAAAGFQIPVKND